MKLTKEEKSWILYDCANSAYSMAITTAFLPAYFSIIRGGESMELGFYNSIASIVIALLSPILGTIADYKGYKKSFFIFFAILGIFFTGLLAISPDSMWVVAVIFYIITAIGFAGANIFYDAFLVDITDNSRMDRVSTSGFAYGYIASVIPFSIGLAIIVLIGDSLTIGYKIGFVITALWWGLLSIPMIKNVKQVHYVEREKNPIKNSFIRLNSTIKNIKKHKYIGLFLIAYFLYIDGVDTIIKMSVPYAKSVIPSFDVSTFQLLLILLIVQVVAFPCALIFGRLSKKISAKKLLMSAIIIYMLICIYGYFIKSFTDVLILGCLIGTVQGGIQALSRSYYAKIIPKKNSNEFFGFYNIFGKFAAIIGPSLMAITAKLTNKPRFAIISIVPLFLLGFIVFLRLPDDSSLRDVQ